MITAIFYGLLVLMGTINTPYDWVIICFLLAIEDKTMINYVKKRRND